MPTENIERKNIEERNIVLPKWLDDLVFIKLGAKYSRANQDMLVIDWNKQKILNYLGTYFPRSFAESYCIYSRYFRMHQLNYVSKDELSIFDFGCGTGGELIGLLLAIKENCSNITKVNIRALDGNVHALRILESVLNRTQEVLEIEIKHHIMPLIIDDFYDLSVVKSVLDCRFDIFVTFKAICEFVTKQQFEENNPYSHIINTFRDKVNDDGIMCLADVTSYNDVSQDWLPKMLDRGVADCGMNVLMQNDGYNETYRVSHSQHKSDISKIAWRIIKNNIS